MAKDKIQKTDFDNKMKQFISLVKKHERVTDTEIVDTGEEIVIRRICEQKQKTTFRTSSCRIICRCIHSHTFCNIHLLQLVA